ncbi:polyamine-modulated factor 1-binding protein 1 [Anopheles marshallii]|uniref:polyamine-modulated factor 1-binding protein 1 n=1 Tax=Anopheles marshallii TaxID=1521116 RepID=UPI00237A599A|nr:polyamine-modulated factor 1-binding protein 1 [Anopheles marshallii]
MKTGYGLNTADSLGYLGYGSKPYSSLTYLGSKGYSAPATGVRSKSVFDKDVIMSKVKKPKLRKTSTEKIETPLYKKKTFDFTDYAYREAVNRLKFLLTEAYEPTKAATSFYYRTVDDGKSEASDSQSVVERPSITEVSKYFPSSAVSRYGSTLGRRYSFLSKDTVAGPLKSALSSTSLHPTPSVHAAQSLEVAQPPPELLGFIEKQESYIEQLERESQYCREELSTLLKKVKEVVSENEALTDRSRSKALYQLDSSESEDVDYGDRGKSKGPLSGPSIVFESRISELEAQLAQSQIDLKKLFNENEENKRKLLHGASDVGNADAYRKQVENLQRDKQNLEETVRKLQLSIDQLKDTEACNFSKSQRSRDMIEQVAFERNQAEIEIRRLKDELERQHERVREVQHEMAKRIADERASAERRYTYHVDQLGGDLSSQWEHATKLQLEVERMKRIESDYKRELNQKNSQIDELKMELKNKSAIFMSDLNQGSAEKQSLEQEITSLRLQLERTERQSKVEVSRLNAEITSLRQRLDRADADLLHSKRENLKLADEVASLEKELTLGELNRETRPSKELAKIISDMEAKHTNTVSELEGMIQDQKQLMEKLTAECKSLTHKLEDTTQKHKEEKRELRQTNSELMERLKQIWHNYKQISPAFRKSSVASSGGDLREPVNDDSAVSHHDQLSTQDRDPEAMPPVMHHRSTTVEPCQPTRTHSMIQQPVLSELDDSTETLAESHPDPNHAHPIDSSTPHRNNHPNCRETIPSPITSTPASAANRDCPDRRSPTKKPCGLEAFQRSRSMDVLWNQSVCHEPVIPLNRTASEVVQHREAAEDCRANPWPTREPHGSRCNQWQDRSHTAQRTPLIPHTNTQLSNSTASSLTSRENSNSTRRWTINLQPDMIHRNSSTPTSSSTKGTQSSTINSRSTISSSTRAISSHMMHSSTPLSKFMMNPATPPEPVHYNSLSHPHLLQQHHQHQHQQSHQHFQHNLQHKYPPQQQSHPHHPPPRQQHRFPPPPPPPPLEAANNSQENLLAQWNRRKVTELWGIHVPVHHPEQVLTDSDTNNHPAQDDKPATLHSCCSNSLPRQQLPKTCGFQPIDSYPKLTISSPSLFGSSPDVSQTPSPTSTVLKNYDAASPNPI